MELKVINHPLVQHKLTVLRDENTTSEVFRNLVGELVALLSYEATEHIKTKTVQIKTPVAPFTGVKIADPKPLIVPILRAGLGMLDGMMRVLPSAEVGFLGIKRNEETLEPFTYANRLPDDVTGRQCLIIDPMLATGGTLIDSINYLYERGAKDITCVCILAAPEGISALENAIKPLISDGLVLKCVVGAVDDHLNENGYIVPGLGDAGDRLYGLGSGA